MNIWIILLIISNVILSYIGFQNREFFEKYKFNIAAIKNGEYIRMLSSGFLHVDWIHLVFNMYALYLFGEVVLSSLGMFGFGFIYVVSLITGSLYSYIVHKNQLYYSAVGASGAVSGVLYSSILIYPDMELILFPIPIPLPAYVFGLGYMIYTMYGMKNNIGNIGHSAHLGGALSGFFITAIFAPQLVLDSPFFSLTLALSLVGLYYFRAIFIKK